MSPVPHIDWGLRSYLPDGHEDKKAELGLEKTPEEYVQNMVEVFRGVWRVLRDDGVVWLNLGDSYAGSNQGVGTKTLTAKQASNRGTVALTQAKKSVLASVEGLKPKDLVGIPWRVAFALQADGWYLRSAMPWLKGSAMPESVTDRPTSAVEYFFLLTKNRKYFYDVDAVRKPVKDDKKRAMRGNTDKNKYAAGNHLPDGVHANTMSQPRKHRGYENMEEVIALGETLLNPAGRNRRNSDWFMDSILDILEGESGTLLHDENDIPTAIFCNPQPYKEAHFATFSPRLITPMILAGTSPRACEICGAPWERVVEKGKPINQSWAPGTRKAHIEAKGKHGSTSVFSTDVIRPNITTGWQPTCTCQNEGKGRCIVLDPFAGSGTTNLVAQTLGRDSIYIDRSKKYLNMALKRLGLQERKLKRMVDTVQFQIFGAKEGDEQ